MTARDTEELTVFMLHPDNPCNTTITRSSGDALYSIVTENTSKSTFTTVRNAGDEIIGSLEWRDVLSDRVTIGSNRPVSLGDWIKKSKVPFKDVASFVDDKGRKYKWRGLAPGSAPYLCSEDNEYSTVIARFKRSRRIYTSTSILSSGLSSATLQSVSGPAASLISLSPTLTDTASITSTLIDDTSSITSSTPSPRRFTPATLELTPRALEIQDLVVMSFLFLEKNRRTRDQGGLSNDHVPFTRMAPMGGC